MSKAAKNGGEDPDLSPPVDRPLCGIVMPISAIDNCPASHWVEVRSIIEAAAEAAGFRARLVSKAEYVAVIQKEIIQNLYNDPIVVCDVSGRNPNVMFELGLRLAFDKPTIIIKDDCTDYAFDTSPIEHLEYPRGFVTILSFKDMLADKIRETYKRATKDADYSKGEFIIEELREMKSLLRLIATGEEENLLSLSAARGFLNFTPRNPAVAEKVDELFSHIRSIDGLANAPMKMLRNGVIKILLPAEEIKEHGKILARLADQSGFDFDIQLDRR